MTSTTIELTFIAGPSISISNGPTTMIVYRCRFMAWTSGDRPLGSDIRVTTAGLGHELTVISYFEKLHNFLLRCLMKTNYNQSRCSTQRDPQLCSSNFLIWDYLNVQICITRFSRVNIKKEFILYSHKWVYSVVVSSLFTTFSFEIIYPIKIMFEFLTLEIQFFQTTSDGETTKTKVVDFEKLYNFVVDNFFI
jgi:hypothetical protein